MAADRAPRLYFLHPLLAGRLSRWPTEFQRIRAMGFTGVVVGWPFPVSAFDRRATATLDALHPLLAAPSDATSGLREMLAACGAEGLDCLLELGIDRAAAGGALQAALPGCWRDPAEAGLDPRELSAGGGLRLAVPEVAQREALTGFWSARLQHWRAAGLAGVLCHVGDLPLALWETLLAPLRGPGWCSVGWLPGRSRVALQAAAAVFDMLPSSAAWWDGTAPWLAEEYSALRPHTRLLACPDDPFGPRLATAVPATKSLAAHRLALGAASLLADGWMLPMGFEYGARQAFGAAADHEDFVALREAAPFDLCGEIAAANALLAARPAPMTRLRQLTGAAARPTLLHREEATGAGTLVALNPGFTQAAACDWQAPAARLGARAEQPGCSLPPGGAALMPLSPARPVTQTPPPPATGAPRLAIEAVTPSAGEGRFAVKRLAGETVLVEADIFADGHEMLSAELRWRAADEAGWRRAPMRPLGNDRWQAGFLLERPGRHVFAIEAWWDHFATFRRDLARKHEAGLDLALEIREGRLLLEQALAQAAGEAAAVIGARLAGLDAAPVACLLDEALAAAMREADPRPHATGADILYPVEADREAAQFASWYELFPRSATGHPARHGTLRDVIARLPAIRAMGFDVLYFPPIHPIGRINRKGPNNTLTPGPDDPGSPYAIGSEAGGHDAIHPELGTDADFRDLVTAAAAHGLELALDFAVQCAPDHPWLAEHPGWFQWRPDGSMKYAENPPKKYQDIVNVDFYAADAVPALWLALRDAVQHWVDRGVRIFRVDNPHTKPFPFWEWLIADIRARDPGVLFLAEAFTRPKVMYRLGKIGFSQSYTYFTWRNTKAELSEYIAELNQAPACDIFRPNFFVNTPDINPFFLQTSGRAGFLIRACLAATLSGLWGVYSGFEICEAAALPGREEYLDSEKYQIRVRDYAAPGNIVDEITRLNAIRCAHPALQTHLGTRVAQADSEHVLLYARQQPGAAELILVAVNLDPHRTHACGIELPLWQLGFEDHAEVAVEDLMRGHRFTWQGRHQHLTIDPADTPFRLWRIAPIGDAAR